jgi:hypothetical protein
VIVALCVGAGSTVANAGGRVSLPISLIPGAQTIDKYAMKLQIMISDGREQINT